VKKEKAASAEIPYSWMDVNRKKCSHCGLCIEMCPMDVLRMGTDDLPYMRHRDDCWYCNVCVAVCPRNALTMTGVPYLIR
jgi:NAD-dependent dihydropyrimidine dehydrogenase PreA subunit